ncbi:hypothetical protein JI435_103400, partial [Parastagonospora nodorum SN15]
HRRTPQLNYPCQDFEDMSDLLKLPPNHAYPSSLAVLRSKARFVAAEDYAPLPVCRSWRRPCFTLAPSSAHVRAR